MNLVYGRDAEVAEFVRLHAPHAESGFEKYVAIGVEEDGQLIAGWVYNDYHQHTIQISIASLTPKWCSRRTLQAIFVYPFVQLDCKRITVSTGRTMTNVRDFILRLGFIEEGMLRQGYDDDDAVIYGMLRDECQWVKGIK